MRRHHIVKSFCNIPLGYGFNFSTLGFSTEYFELIKTRILDE